MKRTVNDRRSGEDGGDRLGNTPPALLTLAMIRRHYLPLAVRTIFRLISAGKFPKADIGIGGKVRLWRRETVEAWIQANATRL